MDPEIAALRGEIDALDAALLATLARRREVVARLFARKQALSMPRLDSDRERALLDDRGRRAAALGLPEDLARELFGVALRMSHRLG